MLNKIAKLSNLKISSFNEKNKGYEINLEDGFKKPVEFSEFKKGNYININNLNFKKTNLNNFNLKENIISLIKDYAIVNSDININLVIDNKNIIKYENLDLNNLLKLFLEDELVESDKFNAQSLNFKIEVILFNDNLSTSNFKLFINSKEINENLFYQNIKEEFEILEDVNYNNIYLKIITDSNNFLIDKNDLKIKYFSELINLIKFNITSYNQKIKTNKTFKVLDNLEKYNGNKLTISSKNELFNPQSINFKLDYVGHFLNKYLLFQALDDLFMIDYHKAVERILYESFLNNQKSNKIKNLIIPYKLNLNADHLNLVYKNNAFFKRYNFILNKDCEIMSHPKVFDGLKINIIFNYLIECLKNKIEPDFKKFITNEIKNKTCINLISDDFDLDILKVEDLIFNLLKCLDPYNCPHGTPIIIKINKEDLENLFNLKGDKK